MTNFKIQFSNMLDILGDRKTNLICDKIPHLGFFMLMPKINILGILVTKTKKFNLKKVDKKGLMLQADNNRSIHSALRN